MNHEAHKELKAEAASRARDREYNRLMTSVAGMQEVLQDGDNSLLLADLDICGIVLRIIRKSFHDRSPQEEALFNRLDTIAWRMAKDGDYSDALAQEELTRAEQKWEADRDCALLEPQA